MSFSNLILVGYSATAILFENEYEINEGWFTSRVTGFAGNNLTGTQQYKTLKFETGGDGMERFENHGRIAWDEASQKGVYRADLVFSFYVTAFTDADIEDVYNYDYEGPHTTGDTYWRWLRLHTAKSLYGLEHRVTRSVHDYQRRSYYLEFGRYVVKGFDSNDYDGGVRVECALHPDLPIEKGESIVFGGVEWKIPDYEFFVSKVKVADKVSASVGEYDNKYATIDAEQISSDFDDWTTGGRSEPRSYCDDGLDRNFATGYSGKTAKEWIAWAGYKENTIYKDITYTYDGVGQDIAYGPSKGSTWGFTDDITPDTYDFYTYEYPIHLRPHASYDWQEFRYRHTELEVDIQKESFLPEYGVYSTYNTYEKNVGRIVAFKVLNKFVKIKFEAYVTMLAEVEMVGEVSDGYLDDPEVERGDIMWNDLMHGHSDVKAEVTTPTTWWTDLVDGWGEWWEGIGDWWNDVWTGLGDWFENNWMTVVLIGIIVVAVVTLIYVGVKYGPSSLARARGTQKREKIKTKAAKRNVEHR